MDRIAPIQTATVPPTGGARPAPSAQVASTPEQLVNTAEISVVDAAAASGVQAGQKESADKAREVEEQKDPVQRAEEALDPLFSEPGLQNTRLSIDIDEGSGEVVYRSVDRNTGEVVKQYPSDEVLRRLAFYREVKGIAVDDMA